MMSKNQLSETIEHAEKICSRLRKKGFEAFIVGGAVRDYLLGKECKDIDIATSACPADVEKIFKRTIGVGKQFGVMIVLSGDYSFEVATFRKDIGYTDGRRPDKVEFSNAREDVLRRDFTINGLFWHPEKNEIIDYVNGQEDLRNKLIRCIGDPVKRFSEDRLRILRALRFSANLNFEIEKKTLETIKSCQFNLDQISNERIRVEFEKIITRKNAEKGLRLLNKCNLISYTYCPEFDYKKSFADQLFPALFIKGDTINISTALAALYLFSGIFIDNNALLLKAGNFIKHLKILDRYFHKMTFSNKVIKSALTIMEFVHKLFHNAPPSRPLLRKIAGSPYLKDISLILHALQRKAPLSEKYLKMLETTENTYLEEDILPPPLINGADLKKTGLQPGPLFSKIIEQSYYIQLDQNIKSKELLIDIIKKDPDICV